MMLSDDSLTDDEFAEYERLDNSDLDSSSSEDESDSDTDEFHMEAANEAATEQEIEGDFDRLVRDIRERNLSAEDASVLAKDWDITIEEQDADFNDDLREASGIGRKKKRRRSRRTGPNLSQQVKALMGDGNQAYVDGDVPKAIDDMQEVLRIEPRASQAWIVLARCYEDTGQNEKALQLWIMAAHLRHDAEEWERLARQSRDLGYIQQALYCYRKVYSLNPDNVDALWDRATLAKSAGDLRTTRHSFLAILKRFPHDLTVLEELRGVLIELSDYSTCSKIYQQAFDHYQLTFPEGRSGGPSFIPGGGFDLMRILTLVDLYNVLENYDQAIFSIKQGCRWLQGRGGQRYWDQCTDDREYDIPEVHLRTLEEGDIAPGCFVLDVNARQRLAISRIKTGDIDEGKVHADIILAEDPLDYAPLFVELADAFYEKDMFEEARPIYELLGSSAETSSLYILIQTASCLRMLDQLRDAAEVYEQVRLADPTNNESKMNLAEIYEVLNEPRKALALVYEVIDSRKRKARDPNQTRSSDTPTDSTSLFLERGSKTKTSKAKSQNRLTIAELRVLEAEREKDNLRGYKRVQETWAGMLSGDEESEREWMLEAEKMIETFRETRNLFSTQRRNGFRGMLPSKRTKKTTEVDEDRMASRLQLDLASEGGSKGPTIKMGIEIFRGVTFQEWLRVFMQFAFNLTQRGQHDVADEILRHALCSIAYMSREHQDTLRLALMTCAIFAQNFGAVVEHSRKLMLVYQFNNEPLRIMLACLSAGMRPTDAFITSTLQKHLFRETKLADAAVTNPDALKWLPITKRYCLAGKDEEDKDNDDEAGQVGSGEEGRPMLPSKLNPMLVSIYGQVCVAAKSYQSAIFYLLHAYDYCPQDPMICLCLAIASIGRAMQRQADNRQHLIAQGMAFLSQYRALREKDEKNAQEVEYNFGRLFHQLGLYTYAVKHYEKVLEMAEAIEGGGFCREAAYNLSLILVTTGATPLADELYRKWLSV